MTLARRLVLSAGCQVAPKRLADDLGGWLVLLGGALVEGRAEGRIESDRERLGRCRPHAGPPANANAGQIDITWDALGVKETAERLQKDGFKLPAAVQRTAARDDQHPLPHGHPHRLVPLLEQGLANRAERRRRESRLLHVVETEERHVFGHAHKDGEAVSFDASKLTEELPHCPKCHYRILDCGMKSFPIEALSHAPLTAMLKVVKENGVEAEDVAEITVEVIARAADILGDPHKYRPNSKETADHSLPYSLAVGLMDGMVTPLQFKDERIRDPKLIPVMDKVKVVANQEFESLFPEFQPSRVTLKMTDGRTFAKRVDVPKGDPRDPMTDDEIKVKFDALGRDVIGQERCDAAGRLIMSIEREKSLDGLFAALTK